ncbi:N-acetylglucosamine-6-phosphate deacetylase [Ferrimonas senticii]|uniref:N-acetylglucosamine-6-phosphate deacetylase n=1 Tax=Ferrimonas senticii TaxID=394566 RepID=UPI00040DC3D5|nr:N-acetylglucosamine-6-phosphate deacetylase [Ferrimonas senticii]
MQSIRVAQLFDGKQWLSDQIVDWQQGEITAIGSGAGSELPLHHGFLTAGFTDLQVNGGGGVLVNATPNAAAIWQMLLTHAQFGTTAMLPTVITDSLAVMTAAADAVAALHRQHPDNIVGIHFEGPHISYAKKGAHNADFIRPISDAEWQLYGRDDLGVKLVTVAPETVSPAEVTRLTELGCKVFVGHSDASFAQAQAALNAGAVGFTHLYNAMSALGSRAPGMVGAALLDDASVCGLIVDGHHSDFGACQLAIKTKGYQQIALVTDAMPPVGVDQQQFTLVNKTVYRQGDKLVAESGELAGSALDMASAVRNCVQQLKLPLSQALAMATAVPATVLGLTPRLGQLGVGKAANMVLLDDNLEVVDCWLAGQALARLRS